MLLTSGKETYEAGDVIVREGSHGAAVYVVSSGTVEISTMVQGKMTLKGDNPIFSCQEKNEQVVKLIT